MLSLIISPGQNDLIINYKIFLLIAFVASFAFTTFSKNMNKYEDKIYKLKANNPSNISTVSEASGGVYIFWEESNSPIDSKVYFAYCHSSSSNLNSLVSKRICEFSTIQKEPISAQYLKNDAVIVWKDYSSQFSGDLYIQRISGYDFVWGEAGVKVTNSSEHIFDFSFSSDNAGNIFLAYTSRQENYPYNYKIMYQRILSDGSLSFKNEPIVVESSARKKNKLKIVNNNKGEAFLFWIETLNNKESLLLQKVDQSGKLILGKKPIRVSGALSSTIDYCVSSINSSMFYIAWESGDKNIYHQLINNKGKAIWSVGGVKAALTKNKNFSPQIIYNDSLPTLSWINEFDNMHHLYLQRFKLSGKKIWNDNGVIAVSVSKIINFSAHNDSSGDCVIYWIGSYSSDTTCRIGTQIINNKGIYLLDSISSSLNSINSCEGEFISSQNFSEDQAALVYKDDSHEIILGFLKKPTAPDKDFLKLETELEGNSITLKVESNIRNEKSMLIFERLAHSDTSANIWELVGTLNADLSNNSNSFQITDHPTEFGTLYYRTILKNNSKEIVSNISRIDFLEAAAKIVVAQNNPNPFRDSTVISFYLPAAAFVGFEFFDSHAEKIAEFPEKSFPAGENSITFYAKDLIPGIYFFRFTTINFVEVKKMMIIE